MSGNGDKSQEQRRIVLVNYADRGFFKSQQRNTDSALHVGQVDTAMTMGLSNLSKDFRARNAHFLKASRGAGWWIWKPEIILWELGGKR